MALGNQGRLSEALDIANEGLNLAKRNNEGIFITRFPNIIGWIYRELQDFEAALKHDTESLTFCNEVGEFHAEANARINLAHDCLALGEPETAHTHLQRAEHLVTLGVWMNWRFNIRLQAEMAAYWMARDDLVQAALCAAATLEKAKKTAARKYIAWAYKLLGDIAVLEDRMNEGKKHYHRALQVQQSHPCPTQEWKILTASAALAKQLKDDSTYEKHIAASQAVIQSLADSVADEKLRAKFLSSEHLPKV